MSTARQAVEIALGILEDADTTGRPFMLLSIEDGNNLKLVTNIPADMVNEAHRVLGVAAELLAAKKGN